MAGGVLRRSGGNPLSHGCAVPAPPEGKPRELLSDNRSFRAGSLKWRGNLPDEWYSGTTSLAPRIYEGGGPRSGRGSPPPRRREPSQSRFACQLSRRESQGSGHRSPVPFNGRIPTAVCALLGMTGYFGSLHTGWFSRNGSLFCSGHHRTIASASLRRLFAELRGAALGFLLFTLGHGQFVAAVVFFVGGVTLDPVGADLMELT